MGIAGRVGDLTEAERTVSALLPDTAERRLALVQLLDSAQHAQAVAPSAWGVTLQRSLFRLNVGRVEVLVVGQGRLRLNCVGKTGSEPFIGPNFSTPGYRSVPEPKCAFVGPIRDFAKVARTLRRAHHKFIETVGRRKDGTAVSGSPLRKSHSAGLIAYAEHFVASTTESSAAAGGTSTPMKPPHSSPHHFLAYHSAAAMGYEYQPDDSYVFHTSKPLALLHKAIGSPTWVLNGTQRRPGETVYTLRAVFFPEDIVDGGGAGFKYAVVGSLGVNFNPPIELNHLPWFATLYRSQNNFSLGFNGIRDARCIAGLVAAAEGLDVASYLSDNELELPVDLEDLNSMEAVEGLPIFLSHLRRERNSTIVQIKKSQVLRETGRLACEACGFDFTARYGSPGDGYCEVHHTLPLASLDGLRTTTLADLAVVCSNCHRVLHRGNPMPSLDELRAAILPKTKSTTGPPR